MPTGRAINVDSISAYTAKGNDTHNRSETISITGDLYV